MIGASSTMASRRCRPWVCLARLCSRMASRLPGPVQARVRARPGRSDLPHLLDRALALPGVTPHQRLRDLVAAVLLRDLAAAVLLLGPDRPVRRSAEVRARRLGAPTPAQTADSVYPVGPAGQRRAAASAA